MMRYAAALIAPVALLMPSYIRAAASDAAEKICQDKRLTRQEQTLCAEQIAAAQTLPEQKKIQEKFRKRIESRKQK